MDRSSLSSQSRARQEQVQRSLRGQLALAPVLVAPVAIVAVGVSLNMPETLVLALTASILSAIAVLAFAIRGGFMRAGAVSDEVEREIAPILTDGDAPESAGATDGPPPPSEPPPQDGQRDESSGVSAA